MKVDVSVALSLNETFFKLEVAAVESGSQVVRLKDDRIVAHVVVEVD